MPTTVTASNGNSYHLYQLGDMSAPEPSDSQTFTVLENELSEGYRSRSLFGLNTGIRSWSLPLNTLAGSTVIPAAVTDPYSATVSRENYIRNLYKYNKTTGIPFAYTDPTSGQYYLVDIVDDELMMKKIKGAAIYSAELTFRQRRINGVTIFDLEAFGNNYPFSFVLSNEDGHFSPNWADEITGSNFYAATGGVTFGANAQNGNNTVRLNGSTGFLSGAAPDASDIIVAMKVREATFSGNNGLFSDHAVADVIKGTSAGTKWQNPGITNFEYSLNGVSYAVTDMQAPMNTFGVCHFRASDANQMIFSNFMSMGRRSDSAGYLAADIGELVVVNSSLPMSDAYTIIEHLKIKWGVS